MRVASHVYTAQSDIAQLHARVAQLASGAHVALRLDDGQEYVGVVADAPVVQLFFDTAGKEGVNATVRLEQSALEHPADAGWCDLWLDRIAAITPLDLTPPRPDDVGRA